MSDKIADRLQKWAIFTVIFGFVPLWATYMVGSERGVRAIIGHGELFLAAGVLSGDGLGRVFGPKAVNDRAGRIVFGALALNLTLATLHFGIATRNLAKTLIIDDDEIWLSVAFLVAAIWAAYGAVILEE